MKSNSLPKTHKHFSDLPINQAGFVSRTDIVTFILEIVTWSLAIFVIGFLLIFRPDDIRDSFPYILLGMFLASVFWYLHIRTLYRQLHKEKLLNENHFAEIRKRQVDLDKKEKEFIAMTSHQLNTPLSVIRNASSELIRIIGKNQKLTEKEKRYIFTINSSSKRMVTYLNDLLSLIRSDTSILELNLKPVSVRAVIAKITEELESKASDKGMSFKVIIGAKVNEIVCDLDRINTALINLIENGITYGQDNTPIEIKIINSGNYIQFSIKNQGVGIPKSEQLHIFQKFFRASSGKVVNKFGTGLGLSITRDIIVQQGGTIWFESTPKKETTFYFTLPKV